MNAFGNQVAVGASRAADKLVALVERAVLEDDESGTRPGLGPARLHHLRLHPDGLLGEDVRLVTCCTWVPTGSCSNQRPETGRPAASWPA
jgi:hypothetical protein